MQGVGREAELGWTRGFRDGPRTTSGMRRVGGHFESQGSKFEGGIRRLLEAKRRQTNLLSPLVTLNSAEPRRVGVGRRHTAGCD